MKESKSKHSITLKGIPVSEGIEIRRAFVLQETQKESEDELLALKRKINASEIKEELKRLGEAYKKADEDLEKLVDKFTQENNPETASIANAHKVMLQDTTLKKQIETRIQEEQSCAEYAVASEIRLVSKKIEASRNQEDYFRFQGDFQDIKNRLLRNLQGEQGQLVKDLQEEVILIAEDLTPEQTLSLDFTKIKAIAIEVGGPTSHTAIVARTHKIPAIVGLNSITKEINTGDLIVLDGKEGKVIIHPEKKLLNRYEKRQNKQQREQEELLPFSHLPVETLDGQRVNLFANIESPDEIPLALERGAFGIGLYRTEFLFANGTPDEEAHLQAYRKALQYLKGKPLTIRTIDMGGDKFMEESGSHREANPFLGCRSIRLCLRERPELFADQLRAVLRVSAESDRIQLMFPMISTMSELNEALDKLEQAKEELKGKKIPFNNKLKVGIMVEIPSTAIMSDHIAKHVDFFSIGTNDLIQYTLAVDRNNERVAHLYKPSHPSILRLIRTIIRSAHQNKIEVSMCGEMPNDVSYALLLLGMGLPNISVSSASIPKIVRAIRRVRMRELIEISNTALRFELTDQIYHYLQEQYKNLDFV